MSNEFKVGLIGILGLITLYLGSNFLKGYDFVDNDTVPQDTNGHGT